MIEFFTGWWQYSFMRSAFLAVMIITPLFGILGTMIVNRKMAFFSDALGHSALTGIAVGVVLGVTDTNLSMVIFAIIFALLLNKISSKSTAPTRSYRSFLPARSRSDLRSSRRAEISANIRAC